MLRNFLTDEEKAEVDQNSDNNPELPDTKMNARHSTVVEGKFKRRTEAGIKIPVAPNKGDRLSGDQLVRGSTMMRNSVTKRPVTFVSSTTVPWGKTLDEETVENEPPSFGHRASTTSKCSRTSRKNRKVLSVDEIFARGIRDWRNKHDKFTSEMRTGTRRFSRWESGINRGSGTSVTSKDSHSVRKEIERENEERKWRYDVEKSGTSLLSESLTNSSDEDDFDKTETEESSSTMTEEQIHRRKVQHNFDIAADVLKLLVFFTIAFGLTLLPLAFLEISNPPNEVKLNLTEKNICYWSGSKGLLSEQNPCPYRGYISNDKFGNECLRWKDAIEGGNGLKGVGIDNINFKKKRDFNFIKDHLRRWQKMYHERETLSPERKELISDYEHRFCRRVGDDPQTNLAVCLTLGDQGEERMDVIVVSQCWIVPCSIKVASKCYQLQAQKQDNAR